MLDAWGVLTLLFGRARLWRESSYGVAVLPGDWDDAAKNEAMRRVAAEPIATSWIGLVQRLPAAWHYEIGKPLTASKMTCHQIAAALYAPLRVVLYEDADGGRIFEYGQFGDERVTEIGLDLDRTLEVSLPLAAN
jgi:Domain of unknown function DUF302